MSAVLPGFDYAPALESSDWVRIRERYGLFVGGEWIAPASGTTFSTINPATEEALAQIALGDAADVDRAVRAARRGYDKYWRKLRPSERAKYLYRVAHGLAERTREFAVLETLDTGKPIRESLEFDLAQAAAHCFYHAGWADKLDWALRAPERVHALGVVGAVVSSNVPLLGAARKLAPALACGNTIVLKPSETTPLTALLLADVCAEAELPPGVVNVVTGEGRTGAALVEHPDVDKLSFSGSTEVGKAIRRAAAGSKARVSLELGGKPALIVFDDAPLDQAIEGIVTAAYLNRGHAPGGGSRLLVQESVADDIVERLRARLGTLRHGDPLDKNTDIGALNSRAQRDKLVELLNSGVEEGATLVQASFAFPERGFWFPAAFFTNVQPTYRVAREEVSGPILSIMTFRTPDEAIEHANNVPSGSSAGVWTSNGQLGLYAAQRLAAGVVWCSTSNRFDPSAPFGGYKESGFGREGGLAGLREYLDL